MASALIAGCSSPAAPESTSSSESSASAETTAEQTAGGTKGKAGVYEGKARGFGGEVTATVTLDENGKVTDLSVEGPDETPKVGGAAIETLVAAILEAGSPDVDGVTGATYTSDAVINAVNGALEEAGFREKTDNSADGEITYIPGTYKGAGDGRGGMINVEVTVSENRIESITVGEHIETPGISDLPLSRIPEEIVANQSLAVDMVSGATLSSRGVVAAVTDALTQADANIAALERVPVEKEMPTAEDMETEIVIAGGGLSGLAAAAVAANEGGKVILVEKQPFLGGTLLLAGGGGITVNSVLVDLDDDMDRTMSWVKYTDETSERKPDYDLIEYLLDESGKTADYFIGEFGFGHNNVSGSMKHSGDNGEYLLPFDYTLTYYALDGGFGQGYEYAAALIKTIQDKGVTVLTDTKAEQIVMEDGGAKGLVVSNESGKFTIHADKVIIATGGASYNDELMLEANPELEVVTLSQQPPVGNTGDGFTMLKEAGAAMGDGPFVKAATPDFSPYFRFTWSNNPNFINNMLINADGERFMNEAPNNNNIMTTTYMLRHPSSAYYAIFDEGNTEEGFLKMLSDASEMENKEIVVYGKTIEELAKKLEMDETTLKNTYDRYQQLCLDGKDEDFGKDVAHMVPYAETNGFYAARVFPASWGTIGGALTDRQFHPVDDKGDAIPNLYAIGECATSTLFGDFYYGGFSLGYYSTMGRIAAQSAVSELDK